MDKKSLDLDITYENTIRRDQYFEGFFRKIDKKIISIRIEYL